MIRAAIVVVACLLVGCERTVSVPRSADADAFGHSAPTQHTVRANRALEGCSIWTIRPTLPTPNAA